MLLISNSILMARGEMENRKQKKTKTTKIVMCNLQAGDDRKPAVKKNLMASLWKRHTETQKITRQMIAERLYGLIKKLLVLHLRR